MWCPSSRRCSERQPAGPRPRSGSSFTHTARDCRSRRWCSRDESSASLSPRFRNTRSPITEEGRPAHRPQARPYLEISSLAPPGTVVLFARCFGEQHSFLGTYRRNPSPRGPVPSRAPGASSPDTYRKYHRIHVAATTPMKSHVGAGRRWWQRRSSSPAFLISSRKSSGFGKERTDWSK